MERNSVQLQGNVVRDVKIMTTKNGKQCAIFTLAVFTGRDKPALFLDCKAWGTVSDGLTNLTKGTKMGVSGFLGNNNYTNKDGVKINKLEVIVMEYEIIKRKEHTEFVEPSEVKESDEEAPF